MDKQGILDRFKANEAELRARGVCHAALSGSRARGDNRADSDTDVMIEIDPAATVTVCDDVDLKEFIASLFDGPVDVVNRAGLKPWLSSAASADAV
jgi:predicted nucleotidyltransferase